MKIKNIGSHLVSKQTLGARKVSMPGPGLPKQTIKARPASGLKAFAPKRSTKKPVTKPLKNNLMHDHTDGDASCPICQSWQQKALFYASNIQKHAAGTGSKKLLSDANVSNLQDSVLLES